MNGLLLAIGTCLLASCKTQADEIIRPCPPKDLFAPCICNQNNRTGLKSIDCSGVQNHRELVNSFHFEEPEEYQELVIEDTSIQYLPSGVFRPIKLLWISIRRNLNLSYVDGDTFQGSEDYTKLLYLDGNAIEETDIFLAIISMKRLTFASLNGNRLTSVPKRAVVDMPELIGIDLSNNRISELGREAFANCPNLRSVYLFNNRLMVVPSRVVAIDDGIPVSDTHLLELYFYRNKIDEVEPDAFDGIQRDIQVTLSDNRLQILPRRVFQPIFERIYKRNDTSIFILNENPFVCDCRMRWLLENRDYFKIMNRLTCFDTGKLLESYSLEDLGQCT